MAAKPISVRLGGKTYSIPPLSVEQVGEINGRLAHGSVHDRDLAVLRLAWPRESAPELDKLPATHAEISAAADRIIAAAGLRRTRHDQARRDRDAAA